MVQLSTVLALTAKDRRKIVPRQIWGMLLRHCDHSEKYVNQWLMTQNPALANHTPVDKMLAGQFALVARLVLSHIQIHQKELPI